MQTNPNSVLGRSWGVELSEREEFCAAWLLHLAGFTSIHLLVLKAYFEVAKN